MELDRRTLLGSLSAGAAASLAGCSLLEAEDDTAVAEVDEDRARTLAERFAPAVYFDQNEQWFPTDPRDYESDVDGEVVVDGFDALSGYVAAFEESPPSPRVFYHVVEYADSPLAVVQFWMYSVFDQFTTNFHWHDWEVLQVFVDVATDEPQLYVASSHSRSVPNNEHLDPAGGGRPRLLSELGSHSSGLSVNDSPSQFQRFPLDGDVADVTNSVIDGVEDLAAIPFAYGLPRDEGLALPYVVPELDGAPIYDHDALPEVSAADLLPADLTVRSFEDLASPPTTLAERETGRLFEYEGRAEADPDVAYDLAPTTAVDHITDFTGPQLSFEFSLPAFAEDQVASHISTPGMPWTDARYDAPASDITEARHRQALADRYEAIGAPSPVNRVVAGVTNAVTTEEAPEGEGLETVEAPIEMLALFESEPEAVPTFRGIAAVDDAPAGEHTLTINGAGLAPHSETVAVADEGGPAVAGVDGEIPTVAREHATKFEVDPSEADSDLRALAVEDDFAGRLYDAPLAGEDAVYVHRGGAFTVEVRDSEDEVGALRVNPEDEDRIRHPNPATGKAALATYLRDVAAETQAEVAAVADEAGEESPGSGGQSGGGSPVRGLARALAAVADAAEAAAESAAADDRGNADAQLEAVATRLERVASRLADAEESLPPGLARAVDNRLDQADRRSTQALEAQRL